MKKIILLILTLNLFLPQTIFADAVIDNGLTFLKTKQTPNGNITTGFSAPSQWSAIAFMANDVDTASVKNSSVSLKDFLLLDIPVNDNATEYETRILALVAIGANPTNVNGSNFVTHLEGFYANGQLGDTCSLNDDIFGLLALVASGSTAQTSIKQSVLSYLISKQDPTDGGFGFSAPGCAYYSTSADMTAAAAVALTQAKNNGLTDAKLDDTIAKTKQYLLANQDSDGGFGYYGSSDSDTTSWVLIGLNSLGLQNTSEYTKTKTYLLTQQSTTDGGFQAFDYVANTMLSNASTTAQSLIALSGKDWILHIFTPTASPAAQATPSATLAPSPTLTPPSTPTPTPTATALTSISQPSVIYQTITVPGVTSGKKTTKKTITIPQKEQTQTVLADTDTTIHQGENNTTKEVKVLSLTQKNPVYLFVSLGLILLSLWFFLRRKLFINR